MVVNDAQCCLQALGLGYQYLTLSAGLLLCLPLQEPSGGLGYRKGPVMVACWLQTYPAAFT